MSEKERQKQMEQSITDKQVTLSSLQPRRRKLLKSTVAIPVIMTLYSGAAIARTSNMLTPVEEGDAVKTEDGKYACVEIISEEGPPYDVGDIPNIGSVDDPNLCIPENGGILVSSAAYTSLVNRIPPPDL
jgi:hypothetical protein